MPDISSPKLLYVKAGLFVLGGAMASGLILLDSLSLRTATLLALSIWCFARAYYFAFYVIENYVDGEYRYAGLIDFSSGRGDGSVKVMQRRSQSLMPTRNLSTDRLALQAFIVLSRS